MAHTSAHGGVTDPDYRRAAATSDLFGPHRAPVVDGSTAGHIHALAKEDDAQ